jgi:hypothetical protein
MVIFIAFITTIMLFSCNKSIKNKVIISNDVKAINVDYIGTQKSIIINDKDIINKIAEILNSTNYIAISDKDEKLLKFSNSGGLIIKSEGMKGSLCITFCLGKCIIKFPK